MLVAKAILSVGVLATSAMGLSVIRLIPARITSSSIVNLCQSTDQELTTSSQLGQDPKFDGEMTYGSTAFQDDENETFMCVIDFDDINSPYISSMESEATFIEFTEDGLCIPAGPVGQLKERLANILAEPFVELIIATSVLINSLLVALGTLDSLAPYMSWIRGGEIFVSILFCFDFLGRWISSNKDYGKHILNAQFAVDVVVVILPLVFGLTPASFWKDTPLPPGLTSPSGLFNLELLRVLRLRRVLKDMSTFERFAERALLGTAKKQKVKKLVQEWQLQLARVLLSIFTLVSVATGLIYTAEHDVNPSINNYFDALYFGLTTLTTVGFGDISPITWQGKLVVGSSILVGVAVVPAQAAALVEALLEREDIKRQARRRPVDSILERNPSSTDNNILALDMAKACPDCGATFHWTSAQFCHTCGGELDR